MHFKRLVATSFLLSLAACSEPSGQGQAIVSNADAAVKAQSAVPAPVITSVNLDQPDPVGKTGEMVALAPAVVEPVVTSSAQSQSPESVSTAAPKSEEKKVEAKSKPKVEKPAEDVTEQATLSKKEQDVVDQLPETDRFVKLDSKGQYRLVNAKSWNCILDRDSGLVWETKTRGRERNRRFIYSVESRAGDCGYRDCSVDGYIKRVNKAKLCGRDDWRLPNRVELLRLVDYAYLESIPSIDVRYFANTQKGRYWSSDQFEYAENRGWSVDFSNGYDYSRDKNQPAHVRLVSGQ